MLNARRSRVRNQVVAIFWILLLLLGSAQAASLAKVRMGLPQPGFNPSDLRTYRIAKATQTFNGDAGAVVFITSWRFFEDDAGERAFEMYLISPRDTVERAGYTLTVGKSWAGKVIPTFWYFRITPEKARIFEGTWTVYFLFNGELMGTTSFRLRP